MGSSLDTYPDQRGAFWQLLVDHGVGIYFAGHEHLYNHQEIEGVHQVISGTCGAPIYSGYGGDFYHYVLVSVNDLGVSVSVFDDDWEMRDSFEFTEVECSDGIDNDGDTLIDYPDDPGCFDPASNIEDPKCQDGADNDGDGKIDFDGGLSALGYTAAARDPRCDYAWQVREGNQGCGLGAELALLLPPLMRLCRRRRRSLD